MLGLIKFLFHFTSILLWYYASGAVIFQVELDYVVERVLFLFFVFSSYLNYLNTRADAKLKSKGKTRKHSILSSSLVDESKEFAACKLADSAYGMSEMERPDVTDLENWVGCLGLVIDQDSCQLPFDLGGRLPDEDHSDSDEDSDDESTNLIGEITISESDEERERDQSTLMAVTEKMDGTTAADLSSEDRHDISAESALSDHEVPDICRSKGPTTTNKSKQRTRLAQLRSTVDQLQKTLNDLLSEGKHLDEQLASATADLERRTEELEK